MPTIGNNDVPQHYKAVDPDLDLEYYQDFFKSFFTNHKANRERIDTLPNILATIQKGGWYNLDITPNLTIISLNTLWYDSYFGTPTQEAEDQLKWLEYQLKRSLSEPNRKFIIMSHIHNNVSFWLNKEKHTRTLLNWNEEFFPLFNGKYNDLMLKYKDVIYL